MDFDSLPDESQQLAKAMPQQAGAPQSFDQMRSDEEVYGTPSQMAITALEGAGKGLFGPLAPAAERALGVDPEAIRLRSETNPAIHGVSEVGGFLAPAVATLGGSTTARLGLQGLGKFTQAGVMDAAGTSLLKTLGMSEAATTGGRVAASAARNAFEMGLFSAGEEASKAILEDPEAGAENAVKHIGMDIVLGGVLGAPFGLIGKSAEQPVSKAVSEVDAQALEAGDFKTAVEHSSGLTEQEKKSILQGLAEQKPNADEIVAAANRLGAPIMEGMTSASRAVQRAEDALLNSAPTYSGLRRQAEYAKGYKIASKEVDNALGAGTELSKRQVGEALENGIIDAMKKETAPISQLYEKIKSTTDIIPLKENAAESVKQELSKIKIAELSPNSSSGKLTRRVLKEIENLKSVDDIKLYKSELMSELSATASPAEKRAASVVGDVLDNLEQESVLEFAQKGLLNPEDQQLVLSVIKDRKAANSQYKALMEKWGTLAEKLGKGRVYGPQDAIRFIQDRLSPEEITSKLFSKNDSEFLDFFKKNFPNEMSLMADYQKGLIKQEASKSGTFSPVAALGKIDKLEPEVKAKLFSQTDLQKLHDVRTYLKSFPERFNPSGTEHASAFRHFFEHPTGALVANARDFGIEKFIKAVSVNTPEVRIAHKLADAAVSGDKTSREVVRSVLSSGAMAVSSAVHKAISANENKREKLKAKVEEYAANPGKMMHFSTSNGAVPEYDSAFAETSARAVEYLNSIKPKPVRNRPLDKELPVSKAQEAEYNRALDVVQNPMIAVASIKDGTLSIKDVQAVKAVYPALYRNISQKLTHELIERTSLGDTIPYKSRMGLSLFLGQPLDSTMTPQGIQANQPKQAPTPAQAGPPQPGQRHAMSQLGKSNPDMMTPDQRREQANSAG